jgi:hypothetical protein
MLDLENIINLADRYDLEISTQSVDMRDHHMSADPLSVQSLPSAVFYRFMEEIRGQLRHLRNARNESLFLELDHLERQGPLQASLEPERYRSDLLSGFSRLLKLEARRRPAALTLEEILSAKPYLAEWMREYSPENIDV